jgi:alanine dehydrogenase
VRFFSREEVERLIDLDELIDAVGIAMADLSAGRASVPPRIAAFVREQDGLLGAMAGYCPSLNVLAAKLVTLYPRNAGSALPTHQAIIAAFDPANGEPLAVMDGTYITAMRTAACSALSAQLLSRSESSVLGILGTGVQARAHARMVSRVRPIRAILIAGRDTDKARQLAKEIGAELDIETKAAASWEEASRNAHIVCATVHPHEPVVQWKWLAPGTHVTSVGVSRGGAEIDTETILRSKVFVETRAVAASPMPAGSDEIHNAVQSGQIGVEDLTEIGEVVAGTKPGRTSPDQVTLYKSIGVAVQDAAGAALVLRGS